MFKAASKGGSNLFLSQTMLTNARRAQIVHSRLITVHGSQMGVPQAIFSQGGQSGLFKYPMMFFAKKNDKNTSNSSSSKEDEKS